MSSWICPVCDQVSHLYLYCPTCYSMHPSEVFKNEKALIKNTEGPNDKDQEMPVLINNVTQKDKENF